MRKAEWSMEGGWCVGGGGGVSLKDVDLDQGRPFVE